MRPREIPVTFQPLAKTVHVLPGTRLMEAAAGAGLALDMPCGGEGTCRKCRVIVRQGACPPNPVERDSFSPAELDAGHRLACQSSVVGPAVVEVPGGSLLGSGVPILTDLGTPVSVETDAAVGKRFLELAAPERGGDAPDLARIQQAAGPVEADLELLRRLPGLLRRAEFQGTAVVADGRLLDFEPGHTEDRLFGAAFDVGTTTLAGMLLDLRDGRPLAVASRLNPQTSFGDDVLSRIVHAGSSPAGLQELQRSVAQALDEMLGELGRQAGVDRRWIYELAFSGNTTMQQLLCGIDPRPLGEVPFVPATADAVCAPATRLGISAHPAARAYVMPVIGGFVGGDTVAGILATGLASSAGPTLLVDIGTNGEIVLFARGQMESASTAAGPAFEGARISQGMRASAGAVEKVIVDGGLRLGVIGDVPPVGLCGSALIDLAAELLRHGVLTAEGRLRGPGQLPAAVPPELGRRVVAEQGRTAFLLADAAESGAARPIFVTQRDFRELQLATGAIRAGISILLARAGLQAADLEAVLVAGGFGNFIRRSNAQRIGLLPPELPRHRIRYLGNTSLAGARLVTVSRQARSRAEQLARSARHVDLSFDPEFQRTFAESMIFPENRA
jgi:uncharacterized 2Fe-2S/4Fe-4S cluster protein (DUF4445 family)